jgi:hypothetical protein
MKKVSADTVTELTVASGFSPGSHGTPPTAEEMIENIRATLTLRVESLARQYRLPKKHPSEPPTAFEISYERAVEDVRKFEELVANVPNGFKLTPLLYSKIRQEENDKVMQEYRARVRRQFLIYLATNHADELSALGICQNGIDRMKKGFDPTDKNDLRYDISTDHIIERGGGGMLSREKAIDPLLPSNMSPTYKVNHISNFILLPEQVHELKNALNGFQGVSKTPVGRSAWVLMLVPTTGPGRSGFVAAPQAMDHPLYGVNKHQQSMSNRINTAALMADKAHDALYTFQLPTATARAIEKIKTLADQQGKTAIDLMQAENSELSTIFNAAVAKDPVQEKFVEASLKPALDEATKQLETAFNTAVRPGQTPDNYDLFLKFYRGRNIKTLRRVTENLPMEETLRLHELFKKIDISVAAGFNQSAVRKPANDDIAPFYTPRRESRHGKPKNNKHHNRGWN